MARNGTNKKLKPHIKNLHSNLMKKTILSPPKNVSNNIAHAAVFPALLHQKYLQGL
jgi:hypothetical protein